MNDKDECGTERKITGQVALVHFPLMLIQAGANYVYRMAG